MTRCCRCWYRAKVSSPTDPVFGKGWQARRCLVPGVRADRTDEHIARWLQERIQHDVVPLLRRTTRTTSCSRAPTSAPTPCMRSRSPAGAGESVGFDLVVADGAPVHQYDLQAAFVSTTRSYLGRRAFWITDARFGR